MGKSSKDKRDAYYRLAKEQGWRARSAFKLLQLDEEFNLLAPATRVVDLCAAPGSWSQVLSRVLIRGEHFGRAAWTDRTAALRRAALSPSLVGRLPQSAPPPPPPSPRPAADVRIVAVDLQPIAPLEGVTTLRADITAPTFIPMLLHALDPDPPPQSSTSAARPVDLLLSDGAPDVTGLHDLDTYVQSQLLHAALSVARAVLRPGGTFVAKVFRAGDVDLLYAQLRLLFAKVTVAKPRSSRASSVEAFVVCEGFAAPEAWRREGEEEGGRRVRADGVVEVEHAGMGEEEEEEERWIAPFLACGDLDAFDADATYHLPADHVSLDPVQPPTAPPYKRALEIRRTAGGAYGKTKGGKEPPPVV